MAFEKVKGMLFWQFTGKQMGIVESVVRGSVMALSQFLGRWMCGMKTQQHRANHLMELQLEKGQPLQTRHVLSSVLYKQ